MREEEEEEEESAGVREERCRGLEEVDDWLRRPLERSAQGRKDI